MGTLVMAIRANTNNDLDEWWHMALLGHNELKRIFTIDYCIDILILLLTDSESSD